MFYRVHQFCNAIHPKKVTPKEKTWVVQILPVSAHKLFFKQSLIEQRHALDVAHDLASNTLSTPSRELLIAALLHDCGKSRYPLHIWERIYIVLIHKNPKLYHFFLRAKSRLSNPLLLAEHHPDWSAELARSAGLDSEIIDLIRYHHSPRSTDGMLLYEADNRH